jgi:hypothetical protein
LVSGVAGSRSSAAKTRHRVECACTRWRCGGSVGGEGEESVKKIQCMCRTCGPKTLSPFPPKSQHCMTFKSNTALSAPLDTTPLEVWIQYILNPTPEKEIFNIYRVRYFYSTTVYPDGRTCTFDRKMADHGAGNGCLVRGLLRIRIL